MSNEPAVIDGSHDVSSTRPIRVASVPASHVYIRHLAPVSSAGPGVIRLVDPDPDDPRRSAASRWWPPRMLDPEWVAHNADSFDVFHVQFGFDAQSSESLGRLVDALDAAGRPLVYTVHDLRNPHHTMRAEHDAHLDVLIGRAAEVITLTPGAAAEIRRRWGREAVVIPHPHVVDFDTMADYAEQRRLSPLGPRRIGIHVKSLRANMNPVPVIRAAVTAVESIGNVVLRVDGHRDVLEPDGKRYNPELATLLSGYAAAGRIELHVHDFFSDDDLWSYLASLDASILPYRFGTHSGWLEACRDLGTKVIAPTCGFYSEQGPVFTYQNDDEGFDAHSLERAIRSSIEADDLAPLSVDYRVEQRNAIARRHEELYRALMR